MTEKLYIKYKDGSKTLITMCEQKDDSIVEQHLQDSNNIHFAAIFYYPRFPFTKPLVLIKDGVICEENMRAILSV